MKDFSSHFRELVETQLPDDARILMPRGGADMMILVTWTLATTPGRPARRSRMVRIVIAHDALQRYATADEAQRAASDTRCSVWLRTRLAEFNPNHDAPLGVEPPPVTWDLGVEELHG